MASRRACMTMRRCAVWLTLAVIELCLALGPRIASAQDATPAEVGQSVLEDLPLAEVGQPVLEDALGTPEVVEPVFCPTGRNSARFVDAAYRLRVTGKCWAGDVAAQMAVVMAGLMVSDGEVEVEARSIVGLDRAGFTMSTRDRAGQGYVLAVSESGARMLETAADGSFTILARRDDLSGSLAVDRWTRIGLRAYGSTIWALLDGEVVLTAVGKSTDPGYVSFGLVRLGNPDDDQEVSVAVRNLRLEPIADSDPARGVAYRPSERPRVGTGLARTGAGEFVPPAGAPPDIGAVVFEDPITGDGMVPAPICPTRQAFAERMTGGLALKIRGPCVDGDANAALGVDLPQLKVPDGEVRFELKAQSGADHFEMTLWIRSGASIANAYTFDLLSRTGFVAALIGKNVDGEYTLLARRTDLAGLVRPDEWTTMAVRLKGSRLWLLLNDRPVLSEEDDAFQDGRVVIRLLSLGDLNEHQDTTVVIRNLRVSGIANSTPDRLPGNGR
jgi:hypothetical protein